MTEVFQASVERNSHLLAAKWFRYGDTNSKTFFDFHQIRKKKTFLNKLKVDGRTIFDERNLSHYITKFYVNFYTSKAHALGMSQPHVGQV